MYFPAEGNYFVIEMFYVQWSLLTIIGLELENFHQGLVLIYIKADHVRSFKRVFSIPYGVIVTLKQWNGDNGVMLYHNPKGDQLIRKRSIRFLLFHI